MAPCSDINILKFTMGLWHYGCLHSTTELTQVLLMDDVNARSAVKARKLDESERWCCLCLCRIAGMGLRGAGYGRNDMKCWE